MVWCGWRGLGVVWRGAVLCCGALCSVLLRMLRCVAYFGVVWCGVLFCVVELCCVVVVCCAVCVVVVCVCVCVYVVLYFVLCSVVLCCFVCRGGEGSYKHAALRLNAAIPVIITIRTARSWNYRPKPIWNADS